LAGRGGATGAREGSVDLADSRRIVRRVRRW